MGPSGCTRCGLDEGGRGGLAFPSWPAAEHNADLSHFISYAPVHELAQDDVDPEIALYLPLTYSAVTVARDDAWLEENRDEMQSRLDAWRIANGG